MTNNWPYTPQIGGTNQEYEFYFNPSSTGALAAGTGTITLTTAPGTNLGANNCSNPARPQGPYVEDQSVFPFEKASIPCTQGNTMTFTVPFSIAAGDQVAVVDFSVSNPLTTGPLTASVSSSADGPATTTYKLAVPGVPQVIGTITGVIAPIVVLWDCFILKTPGCN